LKLPGVQRLMFRSISSPSPQSKQMVMPTAEAGRGRFW
jgi:hypothetical protein